MKLTGIKTHGDESESRQIQLRLGSPSRRCGLRAGIHWQAQGPGPRPDAEAEMIFTLEIYQIYAYPILPALVTTASESCQCCCELLSR